MAGPACHREGEGVWSSNHINAGRRWNAPGTATGGLVLMQDQSSSRRVPAGYQRKAGRLVAEPRGAAFVRRAFAKAIASSQGGRA